MHCRCSARHPGASAELPMLDLMASSRTPCADDQTFFHPGAPALAVPFRYVPRSGYLKRLYQAHRMHHAVEGKDGAVTFGFLYAPPVAALKQQLRQLHPGPLRQRALASATVPPDEHAAS